MNTITIQVAGEDLETINIELSAEEVAALYKLLKENVVKIAELEKKLKSSDDLKNSYSDRVTEARVEIDEANTLLTALGVKEKTDHEESYYRKDLKVATRIALYIASVKTVQ